MLSTSTPIVRFAPSPTGLFHVGSARTALFNWLFARSQGGKFLLRVEDTDQTRSTKENVEIIINAMNFLSLDWDGDIDFQTKNIDRHKKAVETLLSEGKAYRCNATSEDVDDWKKLHGKDKGFRGQETQEGAVRLRLSQETITVEDLVFGDIVFNTEHMDDFVISRADGTPTYLLASAVDDIHDSITHVIRGSDHLPNTPKQIALYKQLGVSLPIFAHLPLLHDASGKKLSKRTMEEGSMCSVEDLIQEGVLPDAAVNYLALLGWGIVDNQTIFSRKELLESFSLDRVSKNPAQFDVDKLRWINGKYVKTIDSNEAIECLKNTKGVPSRKVFVNNEKMVNIFEASREKIQTLNEFWDLNSFFFDDTFMSSVEAQDKWLTADNKYLLEYVHTELSRLTDWDVESIRLTLKDVVKSFNKKPKEVFQPIRVAVSGKEVGVGIFEVLYLLGRDITLTRIEQALAII